MVERMDSEHFLLERSSAPAGFLARGGIESLLLVTVTVPIRRLAKRASIWRVDESGRTTMHVAVCFS